MNFDDINARGMVLLGAGKMGQAMLSGWLAQGVEPGAVWVIDPHPSDDLGLMGCRVNQELPSSPAVVILAVKPQMMQDALPQIAHFGSKTIFISVAAGLTLAWFAKHLAPDVPVIRAMPNTPAAISQGIAALIGNERVANSEIALARMLLQAVGDVVVLDTEAQMDAVTALSGSGPAYVFHMIETMSQAGQAVGLNAELAAQLALKTVAGAGALAISSDQSPTKLRENVTSPMGTTAAGLEVLMNPDQGLASLMERTVAAAALRSRELSNG